MDPKGDISQLISNWQSGDKAAESALFEALYRRLHTTAIHCLRNEGRGQSLSATALVHEAYLRFQKSEKLEIADRGHFVALAAQVMRRVVVDRARARRSEKRGGGLIRVEESDALVASDAEAEEILGIDQALVDLSRHSPRQAQLVELRFFAGYSTAEAAAILDISERTARREWLIARTRLRMAIDSPAMHSTLPG